MATSFEAVMFNNIGTEIQILHAKVTIEAIEHIGITVTNVT